ncbi:hypothetical protein [Thalassotalea fusca]
MNKKIHVLLFMSVLSFLMSACIHANSVKASTPTMNTMFSCQLSIAPTQKLGTSIELTVSIQNMLATPVNLLTWYTPFEGFLSDLVLIEINGDALPYQGPMVKRGDSTIDDFVEVGPQQQLTTVLDLSNAYPIGVGKATASLKPRFVQAIVNGKMQTISLCTGQNVTFEVIR